MTTRFQLSTGGVACRRDTRGRIEVALIGIEYWYWWDEVDEVRWFPIQEALERASYRTERELLQRVAEQEGALP